MTTADQLAAVAFNAALCGDLQRWAELCRPGSLLVGGHDQRKCPKFLHRPVSQLEFMGADSPNDLTSRCETQKEKLVDCELRGDVFPPNAASSR